MGNTPVLDYFTSFGSAYTNSQLVLKNNPSCALSLVTKHFQDLRSFEILRSVDWQFDTDFSGQYIRPIF